MAHTNLWEAAKNKQREYSIADLARHPATRLNTASVHRVPRQLLSCSTQKAQPSQPPERIRTTSSASRSPIRQRKKECHTTLRVPGWSRHSSRSCMCRYRSPSSGCICVLQRSEGIWGHRKQHQGQATRGDNVFLPLCRDIVPGVAVRRRMAAEGSVPGRQGHLPADMTDLEGPFLCDSQYCNRYCSCRRSQCG